MRLFRFASWLLAGAVVPIGAFYELFAEPWDFAAGPTWSWATICIVPLGCFVLLLIPAAKLLKVARLAAGVLGLHAVVMAGLLNLGAWGAPGGISLLLDILLIVTLVRPICGEPPGLLSRSTIFWSAIFFGLGVPLALANAFIVMWRAEAIAGERPYCIQYASQTDPYEYEPALTLFDLSGVKMEARLMAGGSDSFHFEHHGLLLVPEEGGGRAFNWSYQREDFLDEAINRRLKEPIGAYEQFDVLCHPSAHYARTLPFWSPVRTNYEIAVGAHHLAIPPEYRPRKNRVGLVINAVAPDFAPYDRSTRTSLPAEFYSQVTIRDAATVSLSSMFKSRSTWPDTEAKAVEPEFGLAKTELTFSRPGGKLLLYTGYDAEGQLVRYADCSSIVEVDRREPTCRYSFIVDGLNYSLAITDVSQWRVIEDGLTHLLQSWEAKHGRT